MKILSPKIIEDEILNNYLEYQYLFVEFQSKFLLDLHYKYQSTEDGNLALYFLKNTHQDILRQKDYDFNFNISYEKFWENYNVINPRRNSLGKIEESTLLPKETVRRKILKLIKQKVLNSKKKNIGWLPSEKNREIYKSGIDAEIYNVCKLLSYIYKKINLSISKEEITKDVKEKFSFYWFHYLGTQLEYFRLWRKQLNDLELVFIFIQVVKLFTSKEKEKNVSHKNLYDDPGFLKESVSSSIGATSIAEITGIPRATCVRKLEILVKLKMLSKNKISKRYYIIPNTIKEDLASREITKRAVKLFSNFFFICSKTINSKIQNQ